MTRIFSLASTTAAGLAACLLGTAPASAETGPVLPEEDADLVEEASQDSMEYSKTFETTEWVNPDTGNRGRITPTETYRTEDGTYCREFHQTVTIGGEEVEAYGTACRQPDGTWEIARRTPEEELGLEPEPDEVVEDEPEVVYRDRVVYVRDRYRYRDWWYPWAYPVGVSIGFGIHDAWWHHRGHFTTHRHRGHRHGYYGGHRGRHHRWHRGGTYRSRW